MIVWFIFNTVMWLYSERLAVPATNAQPFEQLSERSKRRRTAASAKRASLSTKDVSPTHDRSVARRLDPRADAPLVCRATIRKLLLRCRMSIRDVSMVKQLLKKDGIRSFALRPVVEALREERRQLHSRLQLTTTTHTIAQAR